MQLNDTQPLDLRDVTLCAVDTINAPLAARALDISLSQCAFGDAILFTDVIVPTQARIATIDRLRSREAYSAFLVKQLAHHIATPWVLVVQWDGYVLDASRWSESFRECDYIGARWLHHNDDLIVGNGGFSLRSARLLHALQDERFAIPADPVEDDLICRAWRPQLEADYGIRFASADVAARFSYEYGDVLRPTFGFHGAFNMWRYLEDNELADIVREIDIKTLASKEMLNLLLMYCRLRKFACVKAMYARYRSHWSAQAFVEGLARIGVQGERAQHYADLCESA